jgi:DNA-binding MarR family transcriptional regulator
VFAEHQITATRFDALEALSRRGGTARPAELRDMLHLPAQTITSVLDQLQADGLVQRSPHRSDRRSTVAELTLAGREAIDRICPPLNNIEEDCMAGLSPAEQDQLIYLLTKIQDQITQRHGTTATRAT